MTNPLDSNAFLPKPRKPIKVDRKGINFGSWTDSNVDFDKKINYMMEMIKFMPDYERKEMSGASRSEIEAAMKKYGTSDRDIYGNVIPGFGNVVRSLSDEGTVRAYGQAYGIDGLQLTDESAGDFEHVDNSTTGTSATSSLIDADLWEKVTNCLKEDGRSYYDMMMGGIEDKTEQEAYYIMAGMVESRNRIWNSLKSIIGTPGQSSEARLAVFNEWYEQNNASIGAGKIGFLRFFIDMQQSYISHSIPMFGGSDEDCLSSLDQENSDKFLESISTKISNYLGIDLDNITDEEIAALPEEKKAAVRLWNEWLNPEEGFTVADNTDPLTEEWSGDVYDVLQDAIDQVLNLNIGISNVNQYAQDKYKQKYEEWETNVEEERDMEIKKEISDNKKKAEERSRMQKLEAQSKARIKQQNGSSSKATSGNNFKSKVASLVKRMDKNTKSGGTAATKTAAKSSAKTTSKIPTTAAVTKAAAKAPVRSTKSVKPAVVHSVINPVTKQASYKTKPASIVTGKVTGIYKSPKSSGASAKKKWKSKLTIG